MKSDPTRLYRLPISGDGILLQNVRRVYVRQAVVAKTLGIDQPWGVVVTDKDYTDLKIDCKSESEAKEIRDRIIDDKEKLFTEVKK